jgi:hypothetical protein
MEEIHGMTYERAHDGGEENSSLHPWHDPLLFTVQAEDKEGMTDWLQ